jgi:hypothetical protein
MRLVEFSLILVGVLTDEKLSGPKGAIKSINTPTKRQNNAIQELLRNC